MDCLCSLFSFYSPGAASKSPSSAFCLLLRLLTMRCSEKQMKLMLDHKDSPYIRCIGFLYLRYAGDPSVLWEWISPYLFDKEVVSITQRESSTTTVGQFVRNLMTQLDYHGTRLPRLAVSMEREIKVKMLQAERLEERAKQHLADPKTMEYLSKMGSRVRALYEDEENPSTWYDAVVDRVLSTDPETHLPLARPKFVVTFPEYGNTETVSLGEMDMPNNHRHDGSRERNWQRGRGEDGHYSRKRDDYRHDDDDRRHYGGRYRDDDDDDDDDDDGGGDRHYYDRRNRRRGYHHHSHRSDGRREDDRWEHGGRSSRRTRSRSRERIDKDDLMEEVLRRERENSLAKGKCYAARPPTTKASMAKRSDERKRPAEEDEYVAAAAKQRRPQDDSPPPAAAVGRREKTAEELAMIAEKKRKLMARYG